MSLEPTGDLTTSQVRRQRNKHDKFSDLPNETLVDLFEHIHADVFRGSMDDQWSYSFQSERKTRAQRWIVLLSVCRRWRALLLGTRRFWRIIHVYRRPDWLQYCLSLVHGSIVPLSIYFHRSAFPRSHLSLLRPHLNTISVLTFQADPQWALPLRSLFSQAGGISTLSVGISGARYDEPQADIDLSALTLPRLHFLTLREVVPPNDPALYARLRRLDLDSCTWTINFGEFLSIMRGCVNLGHLTLHNALTHATLVPTSILPPTPHQSIELPRLQTLSMRHPPTLNARILAHFSLPAIAKVHLAEDTTEIQEYDPGHDPHTFLTTLPPNASAIIPPALLARVVSLAFTAEKKEYCVRGADANFREIIRLGLDTDDDQQPSWRYGATDPGARGLITIFDGAPVTSLKLCLDFDDLEAGTLKSLLLSFPSLTSFKISGRGDWFCVWEALTPPTIDGMPTDDGAPICPHLESFCLGEWLAGCVGTGDDLMDILQMLKARNAYGLRLRKLDILFMHEEEEEDMNEEEEEYMHEEEEEYDELRATFVPQMQELVDVVDYGYRDFEAYDYERDVDI